jgi:hypothetical protein
MRHPPFLAAPQISGGDFCTREGAERLAGLIRAAWLRAGHEIEVIVIQTSKPGAAEPTFAPRMPGLLNGLPR